MPELRRSRPADIRYLVGATGSGKSWYLQRRILSQWRARVLLWDWKDDHYTLPTVDRLGDLARRGLGDRVLRYTPAYREVGRQFNLFCRIAWAIQEADTATDCLLIVEELAEVTEPSYAPEWWRRICVQGRVYGFTVVGTAQRPAYVDKSFTGSATFIRCGRLGELVDARVIGQRIGVNPTEIQRLPDRAAYVFDGRKTRLEEPSGR